MPAISLARARCGDPEAVLESAVLVVDGRWRITLTGTFSGASGPAMRRSPKVPGHRAVVTFDAHRPDAWYQVEVTD